MSAGVGLEEIDREVHESAVEIDAEPCLAPDASPAALRLLVPRR